MSDPEVIAALKVLLKRYYSVDVLACDTDARARCQSNAMSMLKGFATPREIRAAFKELVDSKRAALRSASP